MTLVIGRFFDNKKDLFIKSDTRLSSDIQYLSGTTEFTPLNGYIKTIILTPRLCLSYAGNTHYAQKFIKAFYEYLWEGCRSYEEFLEKTLQYHLECKQETDFIIAYADPEFPRLDKISNGKTYYTALNAWIGDKPAFEKYQTYLSAESDEDTLDQRMFKAFDKVLADTSINTVGDYHVTAYLDYEQTETNSPIFLYNYHADIRPHNQTIQANTPTPLYVGTPDVGDYGVCYLRTLSRKIHGIALYFPEGKFGLFFCPSLFFNNDEPTKGELVMNVSGKEFVAQIQKRYKVVLQGLIVENGRIFPINHKETVRRES
tara:strand:+ start:823 stop:1767 length:945 start_codon:yes stop_codon:yes gene_type:complete